MTTTSGTKPQISTGPAQIRGNAPFPSLPLRDSADTLKETSLPDKKPADFTADMKKGEKVHFPLTFKQGHGLQGYNRYHETSHPDTVNTVIVDQSQFRHNS